MSGPLPEGLRTLRLLRLGMSLAEQENTSALLLDELLLLDDIERAAGDGSG